MKELIRIVFRISSFVMIIYRSVSKLAAKRTKSVDAGSIRLHNPTSGLNSAILPSVGITFNNSFAKSGSGECM